MRSILLIVLLLALVTLGQADKECPALDIWLAGEPYVPGSTVIVEGMLLDGSCAPLSGAYVGILVEGKDVSYVSQPATDQGGFSVGFTLPQTASGIYIVYGSGNSVSDVEQFEVFSCIADEECDDGNDCTIDSCSAGICANVAQTGTSCTVDDVSGYCEQGVCVQDTEPPLPPTNLAAEVVNSVRLTWTPSTSTDLAGYHIYISDEELSNFDFEAPAAAVGPLDTEWTDLTENTAAKRFYTVRAFDLAGNEEENTEAVGKITYTLYRKEGGTGSNLISIPLDTEIDSASELMADIGPLCDAVNRWNPVLQKAEGWISYLGGMGTDFPIVQGEAYSVSVTQTTQWTVAGRPYESTPAQILYKKEGGTGKNWIGLPLQSSLLSASDLMSDIGTCTAVNRWDAQNQAAEGYIGIMGNDFALSDMEGYEVHVSENTLWQP